jgi:DNA (cytosine-5)-methyltransferase 1
VKYLSVCSGIEAATVAWGPLGWECIGLSEIEKFPCAVLKHHYPNIKNYGDLTQWETWDMPEKPDLIVGGTPCQAFSIAGKRKGFDDDRGNLTLDFIDLVGAVRPEWFVWENVPGVLSMGNGSVFEQILWSFSQYGYGLAWRVLDAQNFGVPQRRRRIFLVGHISGDPRRPGEVLFEQEGLRRDIEKGEEERKEIARGPGKSPSSTGETAMCLNAHGHGRLDVESETFVFEPRSQDGTPRISNDGKCPTLNTAQGRQRQPCILYGVDSEQNARIEQMGALTARTRAGGQEACIAFTQNDAGRDAIENKSPTLRSGDDGGLPQMCVAGFTVDRKVRRITPIEALRLQGFPDDYLINVPGYSDTQAYRAVGNSKAVPVVRWIGERFNL